jgi:hypothetical protein
VIYLLYKVFKDFSYLFLHFYYQKQYEKFNNMSLKVILRVSYFLHVQVANMSLQARWTIVSIGIIINDLMRLQQGLIDNNKSEQRKYHEPF